MYCRHMKSLMGFNLVPWPWAFFSNISKTMRDRDSIRIADLLEIIYALSLCTVTFDLEINQMARKVFGGLVKHSC